MPEHSAYWLLVPFEEDEKDPSVWFLDHNYVESMNDMFKKVNAREKLIGWYHTGPKLRASDLEINELFKRYTPNPLLVIIDVQPKEVGVPTDAYFAVEEIKDVSWNLWTSFRRLDIGQKGESLTIKLGWNYYFKDLCSHTFYNRSRRGRRDRRRAPPPRYPRRRRWYPLHTYNIAIAVAAGPAPSPAGHWAISSESN